jgi:hypothetical protein
MKKLSIALVIGAFVGMLALPQTAAADVKFGIKGGANAANINGSLFTEIEDLDWKNSVGFCAGVFLELNFGRILTIQPEVLYTLKGAKPTFEEGELSGTEKLTFDYIEIPLLLKLRLPTGSFHPFIFGGPAIGFNLTAKYKDIVDGETYEGDIDDFKKLDYSFVLGGGLQLGSSLHLDVRYTMGLQKLIQLPDLEAFDIKNGVISATLGLAF